MATYVAKWYYPHVLETYICSECHAKTTNGYWRVGDHGTSCNSWQLVCKECVPVAAPITHYIHVVINGYRGYLYSDQTLQEYRRVYNHQIKVLENDPVLEKI